MRIQLFEESRTDISISIIAQIESNGDFSLMGKDSGELVKQLKGDWDYEYNLAIKKMDKETLIKRIGSDDHSITGDSDFMKWLKLNYSHNNAYSEFLKLIQKMSIAHSTFIWP